MVSLPTVSYSDLQVGTLAIHARMANEHASRGMFSRWLSPENGGFVFFTANPEASRRLAAALHRAVMLSLLTGEQRVEAVIAAEPATSWGTLPKWLLDVVEFVEGGPAFEVLAGHPSSRVVIHVPHSSTCIPAWIRERIRLTVAELTDELAFMTDARTDEIADTAADMSAVRPWIFVNRRSRLVVDPERFPDPADEPMAAPQIGMGAVYTRTAHGGILRDDDPDHHEALLGQYFRPYAAALTQLVEERLASVGDVTIIDLHSYPLVELPYERLHHPDAARPECCIGVDPIHTPATLRDAAIEAFAPLGQVAVNKPFTGAYVPMKFYSAQDTRISSVMLELRRDTYLEADNGTEIVARILTQLIDTVDALT